MVMKFPREKIPDDLQGLISPFTGNLPWDDIQVHVGRLPFALSPVANVYIGNIESSIYPANSYPAALRAVATAIGEDIYIDAEFADFDTAAGMALLVHELVHVSQYLNTADFLDLYNQQAQQTPPDKPWLNPYEYQAYITECQAYDYYLSQGYPPGDWLPLGKIYGFCGDSNNTAPSYDFTNQSIICADYWDYYL